MAKKKKSPAKTKPGNGKAGTKAKVKLWAKRIALGSVAIITAREAYLGLGARREYRRAVFEQAAKRAASLNKPLLVLGDPDSGALNHLMGRQWQCGVLCIDPKGCGICPDWVQGQPTEALAQLPDASYVIYDPGAFARAESGAAFLDQVQRVSGGEIYMADAGPWTLAAWFGAGRRRRLLEAPQANQGLIAWKPLPFRPEPVTGSAAVTRRLSGGVQGRVRTAVSGAHARRHWA